MRFGVSECIPLIVFDADDVVSHTYTSSCCGRPDISFGNLPPYVPPTLIDTKKMVIV